MRLLGGSMIVGGCLGLGLWYRDQFIGRVKALRTLVSILEMLMSEIRYGKATLTECCGNLAGRLEEPYGECMRKICERTAMGGSPFGEVFCHCMEEGMRELPLKKTDREIFLQAFRGNGFQDGAMQLKSIEQVSGQLTELLRLEEQEQREKSRVAVGLGAMSGLLLILVLL